MAQEPEVKAALISSRSGIWIAIIGLVGGLLIAILSPFATKLANRPSPTPSPGSLAIEQIPQQVFAFAGNNNPDGGSGQFWLIYDDATPIYRLDFSLPAGKYGYAGLAFQFTESQTLSPYHAIELTIIFGRSNDEVDMYIKDISKAEGNVHIAASSTNEMFLRYEFANFSNVNFNAVKEIVLFSETKSLTGDHQVRIKNVR